MLMELSFPASAAIGIRIQTMITCLVPAALTRIFCFVKTQVTAPTTIRIHYHLIYRSQAPASSILICSRTLRSIKGISRIHPTGADNWSHTLTDLALVIAAERLAVIITVTTRRATTRLPATAFVIVVDQRAFRSPAHCRCSALACQALDCLDEDVRRPQNRPHNFDLSAPASCDTGAFSWLLNLLRPGSAKIRRLYHFH